MHVPEYHPYSYHCKAHNDKHVCVCEDGKCNDRCGATFHPSVAQKLFNKHKHVSEDVKTSTGDTGCPHGLTECSKSEAADAPLVTDN